MITRLDRTVNIVSSKKRRKSLNCVLTSGKILATEPRYIPNKRVGCNLLYIGTCMEANQDASVHRIFHQQLFWYRHRHLRLLAFRLLCPLHAALNLLSCLSSMSLKIVTLRERSVTVLANVTHCLHSKMSHFVNHDEKQLNMQYGYYTGCWSLGSGLCSYIQVSVRAV